MGSRSSRELPVWRSVLSVPVNIEKFVDSARRIFDGQRGRAARDRLAEMDINPLLVRAHGKGVVPADAFMVLR